MNSIEYHLNELKIALDRNDQRRVLPEMLDSDRTILDIGCGIGQSFLAMDCTGRICIGIDIEEEVVRYGIDKYGDRIQFILTDAERIPLPSNTIDLVYSRVALPYTNIPRVIREIRRVLRSNGRVWMTLHDRGVIDDYMRDAIRSFAIKRLIHVSYILMNGFLLKYFGMLFPFINGRYESWQDTDAMKSLLIKNGFEVRVREAGRHTIIEGILN